MNEQCRMVHNAPEPPCFSLAALIGDLRPHPELDIETLAYHLTQSDAIAAEGYWHAAVNEARSFLEGLAVGILAAVRPGAPDKSNGNGTTHRTPFRGYRRGLLQAGFIDEEEDGVLQHVYGIASAKGCHPGVTSEVWSRLARQMIFTAGEYMIQHYAAWKTAAAPCGVPPSPIAPPRVPPKSNWRRCVSSLTRLLRPIAAKRDPRG